MLESLLKKLTVLIKLNLVLPHDLAIAILGIYPTVSKTCVHEKDLHVNIYSSFIHKFIHKFGCPTLEATKMSFKSEWIGGMEGRKGREDQSMLHIYGDSIKEPTKYCFKRVKGP
jgi:hypothetical protein